jgi:hypothetical protein
MDNPRLQFPSNKETMAMFQTKDDILHAGILLAIIASVAALFVQQAGSTVAAHKEATVTPSQNAHMEEVVITASREQASKG